MYKYDMYTLQLPDRGNISERISADYETWLEFAKQEEYKRLAQEIRNKRDKLLAETDWTQCADTALSEEMQLKYRTYRQQLRDITNQLEFPYEISFPSVPTVESEESHG